MKRAERRPAEPGDEFVQWSSGASRLPAASARGPRWEDWTLSYRHERQRIVSALASGSLMPASVADGRQAAAGRAAIG